MDQGGQGRVAERGLALEGISLGMQPKRRNVPPNVGGVPNHRLCSLPTRRLIAKGPAYCWENLGGHRISSVESEKNLFTRREVY
jgi:hypothetical protein